MCFVSSFVFNALAFESVDLFSVSLIEQTAISTNFNNQTRYWIDPRYGIAIKVEELVRNRQGQITRSERRELTSVRAARS